ncbi:MAG: hypothetical protein ABSH00_06790 [Bryobacteraceae bacterium]
MPNGRLVRIAGSVIVRQRPGMAKGFVFLSIEDETGVFNVIIDPKTFDRFKTCGAERAVSADRWRAAKCRRRSLGESRQGRRLARRRGGGGAQFQVGGVAERKSPPSASALKPI